MSNINFIRYHYELGFPYYVGEMCLEFFESFKEIRMTYHSANQLIEEYKASIPLPTRADLLHPNNILVELYEITDKWDKPTKVIQKALIRTRHLDDKRDFSYVVARDGFLISAWANAKTDIHRLINREVYFSNFYNDEIELPDALREEDDEG
jgi:hypothetical protein